MANPFTSARAAQTLQALPPDLQAEQNDILRRQQFADMLRKQSLEPDRGTEVVSGWAIKKSPLEGLNKLAQGLLGTYMQKQGDEQQSSLASRQNEQFISGLNQYQQALQGTPAQEAIAPATAVDDQGYAMPGVEAQPAIPGNRQAALAALLRSGDPRLQQMGMQQMMAKPESMFSKIDPKDYTAESVKQFAATNDFGALVPVRKRDFVNGQAVDPYAVSPGTVIAPQVNRATDLLVPDAAGNFVPNAPLVGLKKDISRAGAANTNVNVNTAPKKFYEEVGKGVGEAVNADYAGAQSAVGTLNNVAQIRSGIDKAFIGPTANARVQIAQIGEMLGVGGKNNAEKLANTRSVIQGLARQEMSAAQGMKGQGQITESERGILRRAESGEISDFTVPEIKTLLGALERTANYRISRHEQNMQRLQQDPNAQGVADYMRIERPQSAPAPSSGGFRILGVR